MLMVNTMIDSRAPKALRASAARVVALAAVAGEWPSHSATLVPSLLSQLALAAAAAASTRAREDGGGGGARGNGDAGGGPGGGGPESAREAFENAVDRAESCIKCLGYMSEEVRKSPGGRRRKGNGIVASIEDRPDGVSLLLSSPF